jgi:hypothetical protein
VECVRLLLDSKADMQLIDEDGCAGLSLAVLKGQIKCLQLMIDAKVDVDQQINNGSASLHYACRYGHVDCVRLLIHSNADVQLQTEYGSTGLTLAAWEGQVERMKLMVEGKADINHHPHEYGVSDALSGAMYQQHMDCFYELLDLPFDAPASDHAKTNALRRAFGHDGFSAQAQTAPLVLLVCGADVKEAIKARVPRDRLQSVTSRYRNVQSFSDEWHGVAVATLSDSVQVDTRVGRGDFGLYQEPLERVLRYLGLSIDVDRVVYTNVDGKSARRALIPMQARGAD